ncbi:MAG TPA: haloacid dehalogenase [Chloroflexi bacterium]|nr:haloacid dehalogenase [Chloroflexota bacterium]
MDELEQIAEAIREEFEAKNTARDEALARSRTLIRYCANTIRAVHRTAWEEALSGLEAARTAAAELIEGTEPYPDLYYSGYTQDALKELVEAFVTYALVRGDSLPRPATLNVPASTYLNGLAEAASELRRSILDLIRKEQNERAEHLLQAMDAIYDVLMTFDFPDAITGGLRRRVDSLRGVLERTRGDLTNSLRQERLRRALSELEQRLDLADLNVGPEGD